MVLRLIEIIFFYGLVFALGEILIKKNFPAFTTRKFVHITSGLISLLLPIWFDWRGVVFIGIFFASLLFITEKKKMLSSIHGINNDSWGAVLFPLGVMAAFLLVQNKPDYVFQGAVVTLALSDGLAGLIGQKFGRKKYSITGPKTWLGSCLFFISTLVIFSAVYLLLGGGLGLAGIVLVISFSLILTATEGVFSRGWDNAAIPIVAAALLAYLHSLI